MVAQLSQFENLYVLNIGRYYYLTSDIANINYLVETYNLEIYEKGTGKTTG
jgi:hypothetical protein